MRILLHANDPSQSEIKKVLICAVDTDVAVISIGVLEQLYLSELWLEIGKGKHLRYLAIQTNVTALKPEKSK